MDLILITILNCFQFSIETGKLATNELPLEDVHDDTSSSNTPASTSVFSHSSIAEDEEVENSNAITPEIQNHQPASNEKKYTWRIDLSKSEQYWSGWFENLSTKFLDLPIPKLLLLASIDGLDRALTVGQMQGKFQLQVLARCGHAVHEVNFILNFKQSMFNQRLFLSILCRIVHMKSQKWLLAIWSVINLLMHLETLQSTRCAANLFWKWNWKFDHISFYVVFSFKRVPYSSYSFFILFMLLLLWFISRKDLNK